LVEEVVIFGGLGREGVEGVRLERKGGGKKLNFREKEVDKIKKLCGWFYLCPLGANYQFILFTLFSN
jgi:hypothetical protein